MNADPNIEIALKLVRPGFALDVAFDLPLRGISVLYGASGSGKTTVLRCIAGLESGAAGRVRIGGETWLSTAEKKSLPVHLRPIGYVFQEASLFEHLSVQGNVQYAMKRSKTPDVRESLESAITLLGISHLLDRSVEGLSGGERQRVAIARALATRPQLLLLDEPLSALDQSRRREVLPWLEKLRDELHIPMIYVTHSMQELTRLGDHLVVLEDGKVQVSGPLAETLAGLDLKLAEAEEVGTLIDGKVAEKDAQWHLAKVQFAGGQLWVRDDDLILNARVRLRVLARDVSISTQEPANTSIQNHFEAEINQVIDDRHPSQVLVRLKLGQATLLARITQKSWHALGLQVGQIVWALVKSVAVVH